MSDKGLLSLLPGRRRAEPSLGDLDGPYRGVLAALRAHHPKADLKLVQKAFAVAERLHDGQMRDSGDPYITHPLGVARIVADLGFDPTTVAAALLHDCVEDTDLEISDLEEAFDPDLAALVDGVTKLDRLAFTSKEQQQAATFRKMIIAMARDIRVLVIKIADRLHNMQTIAALPDWKQQRIARETLDIYAPLAHRLGMQEIKWRLEDLAFATLHPKRYAEIEQMIAERLPSRTAEADDMIEQISAVLTENGIKGEVTGRAKHFYSIYEKMVLGGKPFDEIYDLIGVRVLVENVRDCYGALGAIHGKWRPVQGRFKDFIAMPKFNLYQSIHATVVGPAGRTVEVQIRTPEMHHMAEYGVAAHWMYKARRRSGSPGEGDTGDSRAWLRGMVDWTAEAADPQDFLERLRTDLYQDEVYVFTPKGDVMALPASATPVDFAYAIHTEVGHRCVGSKVNSRLVSLDTPLRSGDQVEIVTSKAADAGPSRDWLRFAASQKALSKIRQWFSRERRVDAIEEGRDRLDKALRKLGLPVQKIAALDLVGGAAKELNFQSVEVLYAALGEGHLSVTSFAQRIVRMYQPPAPEADDLVPPSALRRPTRRDAGGVGVHVEGMDDVWARLALCCTPIPGDAIVGYVTRGHGVSVHRTDCTNTATLSGSPERLLEVEWDLSAKPTVQVAVQVEALDRPRLLADVTSVLSDAAVNILGCTTSTGSDRIAVQRFEFELVDPSHLERILTEIRKVDHVYDVYRVVPGGNRR